MKFQKWTELSHIIIYNTLLQLKLDESHDSCMLHSTPLPLQVKDGTDKVKKISQVHPRGFLATGPFLSGCSFIVAKTLCLLLIPFGWLCWASALPLWRALSKLIVS